MEEDNNYYEQMIRGLEAQNFEQQQAMGNMAQNMSQFQDSSNENLVKWQIEIKEELDEIYHLLRGDDIRFENGNIIYTEQKDTDKRPFNDAGVKKIMGFMLMSLNKMIILSNYQDEDIKGDVHKLAREINNYIEENAHEMGMDTPEKETMYPLIVTQLEKLIYAAYLRGLNGGERTSLRTARSVIQTENPALMHHGMTSSSLPGESGKKKSWYNPLSWKI